jgi:riboflavin biosynthesis pyrimidine reductase
MVRERADAVLVGAATVISDDPELTVRDDAGVRAEHQPLRVVLARRRIPGPDSRVFADDHAPTLLLLADDYGDIAARDAPPDSVLVERFDAAKGLPGALAALGERGVGELLVEPGTRLLTSLWAGDGLVDALVTVTAGGMAGPSAPAVYAGEADRVARELAHRFTPAEAGIVGDVSVTVWRPAGVDAG